MEGRERDKKGERVKERERVRKIDQKESEKKRDLERKVKERDKDLKKQEKGSKREGVGVIKYVCG